MANPTTNYGFVMPSPTDLVTDLPADFDVFGQAVDTQMLTNANAAIAKTIVDAKGDLIGASAADTPARLAVGANGTVLTADSAEATGLKWATPASATTFAGCRLYKSAAQSIANNTDVSITFNSELFDTDAYHDTSTNTERITIPAGKAGKYLFSGQINFASNSTGQRWISIKDGTGEIIARTNVMALSGDSMFIECSGIYNCSVGDYFFVQAYQTSGSSLNANGNVASTWFSATYLGA